MKNFFALCLVFVAVTKSYAGGFFDCEFSAKESGAASADTATFKITNADMGAKILYLSTGELLFALPSVKETSSQLEIYVGCPSDGCTAHRFFQSDVYQAGTKTKFSADGKFAGNEFAKSVFNYSLSCVLD
jgi:hypothetical protein